MAISSKTSTALRLSGFAFATALLFSGCDRAEPVTYQIPKESRNVSMPGPAATAQPAAGAPASNGMQMLPGMAQAADAAGELTYTAPAGWEDAPASGIRKANLHVADDNGTAEVTVLAFPGDVGGRLANINRWRGQIGLAPVTAEDLPAFVESYQISKHGGLYIRLEGTENSILGALLPFHGYTWFFKLQGTTATVLANESAMKAFLDSVELAEDGH